jgi:ribosomal protein L37AE/L43A
MRYDCPACEGKLISVTDGRDGETIWVCVKCGMEVDQ